MTHGNLCGSDRSASSWSRDHEETPDQKGNWGQWGETARQKHCSLVWLPGRELVHRKQGERKVLFDAVFPGGLESLNPSLFIEPE